MTMIMEKTRMPRGSRRLRPTGKVFWSLSKRQLTSLLVDQTMRVQRRSSAESTKLAMREREPVVDAA